MNLWFEGKKGANDSRMEDIIENKKRVMWHEANLEALLRKLENDGITTTTLEDSGLRDSLDFYFESLDDDVPVHEQ